MPQQQAAQANNPQAQVQVQTQANLQQLNQAQRISQLVQQQMETNIKQNQPNNPVQNNPVPNNPMPNNQMQNNPLQGQAQSINQAQGLPHGQQMNAGQQQWNFNQMQGTSAQNQPPNTSQSQQFFNQGGMNRFERPQISNATPTKQALSMMLRSRHPSSFMNANNTAQQQNINAGNNPQQPNMGGLPFNIQQQRQQLAMRTAAMRNVNPAQMQAASAANQMNNIGNPIMSGGAMVQQRQVLKVIFTILFLICPKF